MRLVELSGFVLDKGDGKIVLRFFGSGDHDLSLVPIQVLPQPTASKTIELEVSFDTLDDGTNHAMFNLLTYNTPLVPSVFSQISLGPNATNANAYGPYSFVLDHLEVFDIVVKNGDAGKHPL